MSEILILEKIFEQLPLSVSDNSKSKPSFFYGTVEDLNAFLKVNKNKNVYPLVYMITPYTITGYNFKTARLSFIIAVNNANINMSNKERLITVFNKYIYPTRDNIIKAINYSGATEIINIEDITEKLYFRYMVNKEKASSGSNTGNFTGTTIDIWDAIRIELQIKFSCNGNVKNNIF